MKKYNKNKNEYNYFQPVYGQQKCKQDNNSNHCHCHCSTEEDSIAVETFSWTESGFYYTTYYENSGQPVDAPIHFRAIGDFLNPFPFRTVQGTIRSNGTISNGSKDFRVIKRAGTIGVYQIIIDPEFQLIDKEKPPQVEIILPPLEESPLQPHPNFLTSVNQETSELITGTISANGEILAGDGFRVEHSCPGKYHILFEPPVKSFTLPYSLLKLEIINIHTNPNNCCCHHHCDNVNASIIQKKVTAYLGSKTGFWYETSVINSEGHRENRDLAVEFIAWVLR